MHQLMQWKAMKSIEILTEGEDTIKHEEVEDVSSKTMYAHYGNIGHNMDVC